MRIERLEIAGFKSFAEPVALEFGGGATAVVGPNGCGKSNIADAVFWVLGELGAGTIRARGKELIFSGSALRDPLGVAEVRLHVSGVRAAGAGSSGNGVHANGAERPHPGNGTVPAQTPSRGPAGNGSGGGHAPEIPLSAGAGGREVVVSRRVDPSGQSIYEMDGRRCTRRDIQRLFAGTGLGPGSYALIEQGRANEVLSRKPAELRSLVEEAVGLGAYRLNRRESEANLRAAERALERVRERLGELDRYIRVARRDSRTASRVREASNQARLLSIAEQAARRDALLSRIRANAAPEEKLDAERERRSRSLAAFERFVEGIREQAAATEVDLREATRRIGELSARRARAAALLEEGELAAAGRAAQVSRLETEAETLRARLADLETELGESTRRAGEFPARLEELGGAAEELGAARDRALTREGETQSAVWDLRRETDRLRARVGALGLSREQYALRRDRLAAAGLELSGTRREIEARLTHAARVRSEAASRAAAQEEETTGLQAGAEAAEASWRAAAAAAENARNQQTGAERDLAALSARLHSLRELVISREQLGTSTSRIAEAAARRSLPVGPAIGELVEVDAGYELAAERLLGVHRIRIDRVCEVAALVEELGSEETGPCEVVVSELVQACDPRAPRPANGNDRLRDHLTLADPGLEPVVPDAVVTGSLHEALERFRTSPGVYVTPAGASVSPPGIVRFGRGGPGEGFLATRREVAELEAKEEEGAGRLAGLSRARTAAAEAAERAVAVLGERRDAHRRSETLAERLRLEAARHEETVRDLGSRLEELEAQGSRHGEDVRRNDEDDERAAEQLARDEARLQESSAQLGEREQLHAAARDELDDRERQWREADRELTRQNAVASEVSGRAREIGRQVAEDRRRLERIQGERAAAGREEEQWRARRSAAMVERNNADSAIREWEKNERILTGTAGDLRRRLERASEAVRQRSAEVRGVGERLLEVRSGTQEAESLLRELLSEFRRAHTNTLDEEVASLPAELRGRSREEVAEQLRAVKERIDKLGPVNEIAAARLQDLEAERREPESHCRDVEQGIADGLKAIRRQDREAQRIFREGFEAVSDGFDQAFRQLFGGGRAELRLVASGNRVQDQEGSAGSGEPGAAASPEAADRDEARVFDEAAAEAPGTGGTLAPEVPADSEFGVEIAAQPPGKKLQSVRLLSGGEKAMTAIAFLIALFRYRPAPFCLLDEVDAPLDDANVQRFVSMLGELKRDTQLVVITHNRLTMEACEHLYGVTMEEAGVSRLISMQFGDEVEDWIAGAADAGPAARTTTVHA